MKFRKCLTTQDVMGRRRQRRRQRFVEDVFMLFAMNFLRLWQVDRRTIKCDNAHTHHNRQCDNILATHASHFDMPDDGNEREIIVQFHSSHSIRSIKKWNFPEESNIQLFFIRFLIESAISPHFSYILCFRLSSLEPMMKNFDAIIKTNFTVKLEKWATSARLNDFN